MTSGPSVATQTRNSDSALIMCRAQAATIDPPARGWETRTESASQPLTKSVSRSTSVTNSMSTARASIGNAPDQNGELAQLSDAHSSVASPLQGQIRPW